MKPVLIKSYSFAEVLADAKQKADAREAKLSPEERRKREEKEAADEYW